jgi:PleD family two-component response regulator
VLPAASEALIGAADARLYAAKRGGRNMVCATLA